MVDSKIVMSQVQKQQIMLYGIHIKNIELNELFQVVPITEKLSPLFTSFKNYLKYKKMEMRFKNLIVRLKFSNNLKS